MIYIYIPTEVNECECYAQECGQCFEEHEFPSKKAICYDCEGERYVLNEAMRFHAYSYEEFSEAFDDGGAEYFRRGGIYDVVCPTCKGNGMIDIVKEESLSSSQRVVYERWVAYKEEEERENRMYAAECEAERRMGA